MKKFKSAALAFALAASLIGCSAAPSETPETKEASEAQNASQTQEASQAQNASEAQKSPETQETPSILPDHFHALPLNPALLHHIYFPGSSVSLPAYFPDKLFQDRSASFQ